MVPNVRCGSTKPAHLLVVLGGEIGVDVARLLRANRHRAVVICERRHATCEPHTVRDHRDPVEAGAFGETQRSRVVLPDQQGGVRPLALYGEVVHQQLDCACGEPATALVGEHVIANVDLDRCEPVRFRVGVDPAGELAVSVDARGRARIIASGTEEAVEIGIAACDQRRGVGCAGRRNTTRPSDSTGIAALVPFIRARHRGARAASRRRPAASRRRCW